MSINFLNQLRSNPKLRWGIALIMGICWLYALLLLRENLQEQTQQYRATAQSIAHQRAQLAQPEWLTRLPLAESMATQLEERLWQAPTSGLAQAAFQDWLNGTMVKAGVTRQQITVTVIDEPVADMYNLNRNSDSTTPADCWKIKARLGFDFSAPTLLNFLDRIENHEKQIVVGMFNVRRDPMNHVDMELYGYFKKQAVSPTKPSKELVPL